MVVPILALGLFSTLYDRNNEPKVSISQVDSLKTEVTKYKKLTNEYKFLADISLENCTKEFRLDTLQAFVDSVNAENFRYQYKFGRIKSYIDIVNKNSTQSKYLKGWITRVLNE